MSESRRPTTWLTTGQLLGCTVIRKQPDTTWRAPRDDESVDTHDHAAVYAPRRPETCGRAGPRGIMADGYSASRCGEVDVVSFVLGSEADRRATADATRGSPRPTRRCFSSPHVRSRGRTARRAPPVGRVAGHND